MLDFNRERTGKLSPTATYITRQWHWIPAIGDEHLGSLGIALELANGKFETDYYRVFELVPLSGLMGRTFRLEKYVGDGPRDPIEVVVGGLDRCGCQAGGFRPKSEGSLGCKHRDSLLALVASGAAR